MGERVSTGVPGLDEVMSGGLLERRAYLVRGGPGVGKTTLGMHFLDAGAVAGESALLITLGEPEQCVRENALRLGFKLEGVAVLDLSPSAEYFRGVESYDIFSPAEVEREPTTRQIIETVSRLTPRRVFVDSMTQLRYLSADPYAYRKQTLSFLRHLVEQGATVIFASESSEDALDDDLCFLADGIIELSLRAEGRFLAVAKSRGSGARQGRHSVVLGDDGMRVLPRLIPSSYGTPFASDPISSGIPDLDALLHGGLERGTVTIISGPTGVGKTTLALQFMKEAAGRGERSVAYTFEERPEIMLARCEALNIPVAAMMARGTLSVVSVEPLTLAPDELANRVRGEVESAGARLVLIDSTRGFQLSLKGEDRVAHLHALCQYLRNMGVTTFLIDELGSVAGEFLATEVGLSYLADNIIFLRYFEHHADGVVELRKGIGVLKKRLSGFESTLRELQFTPYGLKVDRIPTGLQAIISEVPRSSSDEQRANG